MMKGNKHTAEWSQLSLFDEPVITKPKEPLAPVSQNHILCRDNVFYCEKNYSNYNQSIRKFEHTCEITGQKWETGVWISEREYEENPPITPCKTCEHVKCEWCVFNKKGKELYGCCGACAYRETCPESEWLKAKERGQ